MFRKCFIVVLVAGGLLGARHGLGQIKIGRLSGEPGVFGPASTTVVQADGSAAYITNPASGAVTKFRTTTGEILGTVALPPGIGPAALSNDQRTLAVLGTSTQQIYMIDTATLVVRASGGYSPSGFTSLSNPIFSQDNALVFVADPSRNVVAAFRASDGALVRSLLVGINPNLMTLLPDGRTIAVLCSGKKAGDTESFYLIDTQVTAVVDFRFLIGANAEPFNNVQSTRNGQLIFVPIFNENRIAVFDLRSGVLASRPSYGSGPSKVFSSPDGRWLAVINTVSRNVAVLSLPEALQSRLIEIEGLEFTSDTGLAFSADGRTLFIPSSSTGEVIFYDLDSSTVQARVKVGSNPLSVAVAAGSKVLLSLDVGSNETSLVALDPLKVYMPHLVQSPTEYSGIALANFDAEPANIALLARSNTGALLPGSRNPGLVTVPPNHQVSLVTAQIFGFDPAQNLEGWIEAYSLNPGFSALYLSGNAAQTRLDGFLASDSAGKRIGFSRVTEGMPSFGSTTSTEILIVNPNDTPAELVLRLYGQTLEGAGRLLTQVDRTLAARSRIRSRISSLLPNALYPRDSSYLEVTSSVPVQGLEIVQIGDSIAMIPAKVRGLPDTTFFSPQIASGGAGILDTPVYSNLSLCNTSPEPITLTAEVTDELGRRIPSGSSPVVQLLQPYETLSGDANQIFGFPDPLTDPALVVGSLRVTVDQPGLIGDVLFGDAGRGKYLSSLDLQQRSGRRLNFTHFAQGNFGAPAKPLYTGIAMLNPARNFVNVTIEAFTPDNVLLGTSRLLLDPTSRLSKTIPELIPSLTQQNGGTIRITSDEPIVAFEVFGSGVSEFLSAVPPVVLP